MGTKKFRTLTRIILVLAICAFTLSTVSIVSPPVAMAVEGSASSAGVAGAGATFQLSAVTVGIGVCTRNHLVAKFEVNQERSSYAFEAKAICKSTHPFRECTSKSQLVG